MLPEKRINPQKRKGLIDKIKSSIQIRIQFFMTLLVVVPLIIAGGFSIYTNYTNTISTLESMMSIATVEGAKRVLLEIEYYKTLAYETGLIPSLSKPNVSLEEKKKILDNRVKKYNLNEGHIVNPEGVSLTGDLEISDRDYFKLAMSGETTITEPIISKTTGKVCLIAASPLYENGNPASPIIGVVVYSIPGEFLSDIMNTIKVSENSFCYMIDSKGNTIADKSMATVTENENVETIAQTDSSFKTLAGLHEKMRKKEGGFGYHSTDGAKCLLTYAPVQNNNGWSFATNVHISDFMSGTINSTIITLICLVLSSALGIFIASKIATGIGRPLNQCVHQLQQLSDGNLSSEPLQISSKDETSILASATNELSSRLTAMIKDVNFQLSEMSKGNFTVASKKEDVYIGDFLHLNNSIKDLTLTLSAALKQMKEAANQVALGSVQLSENSQDLAEGATEQASSAQQLHATITEITEHLRINSEEYKNAYSKAYEVEKEAENSSTEMNLLIQSMQRMNETSKQIEMIISQIEDFASQTNLLSLNAAIEAARSGDAGKGFAVVADEVRKLAEDSAKAALNTRKLIEATVQEIQSGNKIAEKTADSLGRVIGGITQIESNVKHVSDISEQQVESVSQIEQGITQISEVIQSNSAAAEESSATSQEFSAQAVTLNDLVDYFKLKK